jgi:inorganic pyrophosphatase/exopolyphosphatase
LIYVFGHNFPYTDIDSIVSSVAFAHLLSVTGQPAQAVLLNPVGLKRDTLEVLRKLAGFPRPYSVTKNELLIGEFALVDHNDPIQSYGFLGINKTPLYCIDHRPDAGFALGEKQIDFVGATSTLIAERLITEGVKLTPILAKALVYAISTDTRGLRIKVSQRDHAVIDYLYSAYSIDAPLDVVKKHTEMAQDVSKMSIEEILNSSLKEYLDRRLGVSMLDIDNDEYLMRLDEVLKKAREDTRYDLYVLMVNQLHRDNTIVYYVDRSFGCFPLQETFGELISRSQDLIPSIMKQFRLMTEGIN